MQVAAQTHTSILQRRICWPAQLGGGGGNRKEPGEEEDDHTPCAHLVRDGEDTASCGVPGGGEARTSPETWTARLAAASPVEVRPKTLEFRVRGSPKNLGEGGGRGRT
jgi:hypothetical protein